MSAFGQTTVPRRQKVVETLRGHLDRNELGKGMEFVRTVPPKLRGDAEVQFLEANLLERVGRRAEARTLGERSLRQAKNLATYLLLSRVARVLGETDDALKWCDEGLAHFGNNELLMATRAGVLEEAGRFDDARAQLEPIISKYESLGRPAPIQPRMEWSKILVQFKEYDAAIALIDELLEERIGEQGANVLLHLRAKACDRKKDFADSWESARKANVIGEIEFDPQIYEDQVSALIENWSKERMKDFPESKCESELPIFVAGMPRSGTSLIDQIIDAHPKASGVGELATIELFARKLSEVYDAGKEPPACFGKMQDFQWTQAANDYVREVTKLAPPGVERVVNKALGNNKLVGLIARLFPRTRIIHAIRDPRDVSISCFMGGFNNRLHPWTTRVEWAARAWEQSRRMMEHWKEVLDVPILDVHYERLVADPEHEFPRLIEFLGLEWDDRCFEFHKTRRTVRTLSYDQVNRPLYKSSSGRHVNYAEQIAHVDWPEYLV